MKNWLTLILLNVLLSTVAHAALSEKDIKNRLDLSLTEVDKQSRMSRYITAGLDLGLGALMGVAAGVSANSTDPNIRSSGPVLFGVSAGILGVLGVLKLAFPTQQEILAQKYLALPEDTPESVRQKVLQGEAYFSRIYNVSRRSRLTSAGFLVAIGAAETAAYFVSGNSTANNYLLYYGVLFCGLGVVQLFVESGPELEYKDYQQWKEGGKPVSWRWQVSPLPNGAALFASLRF